MSFEAQRKLDDAISEHIKESSDIEGLFVTGWTLVASISSSSIDTSSHDGYVMMNSEGLSHHNIVGLLTVSLQDRSNMSLMNMFSQAED